MKTRTLRLLSLLTVSALALTACGGDDTSTEPASSVQEVDFSAISTTQQTEEATEEESSEVSTEEGIPEGMYRSELTNEWIDEALQDQRPVAVMVDNEKTALPHYGLTEADIVYEMMNSTANGRITRLMAIVKDWGNITQFGSIRSVRPTNILLAAEYNAVLCHDGGPFYIDEYISQPYTNNFSGTFSRVDNGKAREYTEYILAGDLEENFANSSYETEYNEYYEGPTFTFSDTEFELEDGSDATEIVLPFPHNSSTLKYNEETGTYDYYEYGSAHTDSAHDDAVLTFENVILEDCTFTQLDENGYMIYNCLDAGRDGYYITNGKAIPITWSKIEATAPTVYYNKMTGEEIELNTGKTYIALVPSDSWDELTIQ